MQTFKYPDPAAHAVGIWMRAAYEGFKLKFGCEFNVQEKNKIFFSLFSTYIFFYPNKIIYKNYDIL